MITQWQTFTYASCECRASDIVSEHSSAAFDVVAVAEFVDNGGFVRIRTRRLVIWDFRGVDGSGGVRHSGNLAEKRTFGANVVHSHAGRSRLTVSLALSKVDCCNTLEEEITNLRLVNLSPHESLIAVDGVRLTA